MCVCVCISDLLVPVLQSLLQRQNLPLHLQLVIPDGHIQLTQLRWGEAGVEEEGEEEGEVEGGGGRGGGGKGGGGGGGEGGGRERAPGAVR